MRSHWIPLALGLLLVLPSTILAQPDLKRVIEQQAEQNRALQKEIQELRAKTAKLQEELIRSQLKEKVLTARLQQMEKKLQATLVELLRAKQGQPGGKDPLPPLPKVEGTVTSVDAENKLVQISIGSDAGLRTGHTLELFRLRPNPLYLGRLTVVQVTPKNAVCKAKTRTAKTEIKAGDRVASKLVGN